MPAMSVVSEDEPFRFREVAASPRMAELGANRPTSDWWARTIGTPGRTFTSARYGRSRPFARF